MLGSHLVYNLKGLARDKGAIHRSVSEGRGCEHRERILWQTPFSTLICSAYEGYPTYSIENETFSILLEGCVYNLDESELHTHLNSLGRIVFGPDTAAGNDLQKWLVHCDGDFLVFILDKQNGEVAVLNDIFGRLPAYYSIDNGCLTLSRDIRSAAGPHRDSRFDSMSIAQYLLLGLPLGKRTWYEGVDRLGPATLIRTRAEKSSIDVVRVHEFCFENEEYSSKSSRENAHNLAVLFREACRRRSRSGVQNVVSLSGGMDSRAVAAGLWREKVPFAAASFLDSQHANAMDFETAEVISELVEAEWYGSPLPPPRGGDIAELLDIKNGFNTLRMCFILPFFKIIAKRFGPDITYFTGDGGGDVLGDSAPYRKTKTLGSLADYLMERYQVFSVDDVASLTGVPGSDIRSEVAEHLAAFPEQSMGKKYRHFFCLEVPANVYNEGEDRNRHYFWSVAPFYSPKFFSYAMNCPDRMKKGYRLFKDFLSYLHPTVGAVKYADWNAPVQSAQFKLLYGIKSVTRSRPDLIRKLRKITGRHDTLGVDSNVLKCLAEQNRKRDGSSDYLNPRAVRAILEKASCYNRVQLWTLFTLTSLIDSHTGSGTVLSHFMEREFIP